LPDDPNVWWPEDVIEYWTRAYIDKWSIDTVSRLAHAHTRSRSGSNALLRQIVTFDEDGISGHANHRAINAALVKASNFDLEFPPVFTLRTTRSVLAKYSSMLLYPYVRISHRWRVNHPLPAIQWDPDVFPIAKQRHEFLHKPPRFQQKEFRSGYSHPFSQHATLLVNSPWQYLKSRTAFKQHKSQVLWFRRLYMFASRYMWFNELLGVDRIHERVVDLGKVREAARKDSL
jgi:N-acetylglucosaminylphosphatidylinositol deacetylase